MSQSADNRKAHINQQNLNSTIYNQYFEREIPKFLGEPPLRPEVFIGREGEIEKICEQLFSGENLLLLVNGRGGIGKTTLAATYYHTYHANYQHLCWVFAGTSLQSSLLGIADHLKLSFPDQMPPEKRVKVLLTELRNLEGPCLFIIDNADNREELEAHYNALRKLPNCHLLVTSRVKRLGYAAVYAVNSL